MRNIELWVNKNCNLKCKYCEVSSQTIDFKLSNKIENELIKISKNSGNVRILGGEPSIYPDLHKIIDIFKKHQIEVFSNTYKCQEYKMYKNILWNFTFHDDQLNISKFIENIKGIKHNKIIVMWHSSTSDKNLKNFYLLQKIFRKNVLLEPTYNIIDQTGQIDISEFNKFKELNLLKYSELLNVRSEKYNKTYLDIFKDDSYKKHNKKCLLDDIIYDVQLDYYYKCCSEVGMVKQYGIYFKKNCETCNEACTLGLEKWI